MSKSIKVSEEVYQLLLEMQRPRETFSDLVKRLLTAATLLTRIEPIIRGQHEFAKWKKEQLEKEETAE